jgi:multidrug efflux pump subunit AcrA (membrane-fusion protein)
MTDARSADARVAASGAIGSAAADPRIADARTSGAAGTGAADTATVTPLDQVLWSVLATETEPVPFARAWLALLCRMLPGVVRAVLVLRQDGGLAPMARWPEGDVGSAQLAHVAELALSERRGVVSRPRGRGQGQGPTSGTSPGTGQAAAAGAGQGAAYAGGLGLGSGLGGGHAAGLPGDDGRASHLGFPLMVDGMQEGVVAVECEGVTDASLRDAMRQLQWGASWLELRQRRGQAATDAIRLRQGYTALEVAATALAAERFDAAARATATEIAVRLDATRVSIGWIRRRSVRVAGLSHAVGQGKRADATVDLAAVMEEAVDQGASLLFPVPGGEPLPSKAAHARLAMRGGGPQVLTVPLTLHGHISGAVTIEREAPFDQPAIDLAEAIAALVGPVLGQLRLAERWLSTIALHIVARTARQLVGPEHYVLKLATGVAIAVVAFFALFHVDYHVSAQASVEGEVRRTIAAGLDGYIGAEHARAGQVVHAGDVLATLDDSELNLQRLRWIATRQQHQSELDRALGSGTRADVNIDSAQIAEATAEIALLDAQLARTQIVAPFDGLVTNGDLSQSVGMPVQRAQVLFEIAPLDSYRVIVKVPDSDIGRVAPGEAGTLVLSALPDRHFALHVVRVTPIAEQSDGVNSFHVEAKLDEISPQLRPNMEGVAKLDAGRHLLIWVWTHNLIDAARLLLWSWWP